MSEHPTRAVICPLCEATCGLSVTPTERGLRIEGNRSDVFSRGYLCPKGTALGALHDDPDRLRRPLVRRGDDHVEVSWDEAFAEVERRLQPIVEERGRDAVGVYFGNPTAHNLAGALYLRPLVKALGTRNVFSAGSVDQIPRVFAAGYVYGDPATVPVPDLDRTAYLLVLGANPLVSNGSLMTAPDLRGRLRRIAQRGKVVVVDPRRTRTAEVASEHVWIRPGGDAFLLLGMLHTILTEDLVDLGAAEGHVAGLEEVAALVAAYSPARVAARASIDPDTIRRLARELAAAESAAVYGRMGTTTQPFGTLTSWLIDVLNVVTGNLDRPGGVMFPLAAAGQPNTRPGPRRPFRHGRWRSRVRGLPEVMGELPAVTLAEEILTPGEGRIRALLTVSGNPALSVPDSGRVRAALEDLDVLISIDVHLNETTRHADVILPGPSALERPHYDMLLNQYAVADTARWSDPVYDTDVPQEWETMLRLAAIASGQGAAVSVEQLDDAYAAALAHLNGAEPAADLRGPERALDILLKAGPYDLTLADVRAAEHGVDLGPLKPRLPDVLSTESGKVELAPPAVVADLARLDRALAGPDPDGLVLIGRRHLRSNNSWMHNVPALQGGSNDCTLQVSTADAARLGLAEGAAACVRSRTGELRATVAVTDDLRPGVVSLPHGWGHDGSGLRLSTATAHPGVNSNQLGDSLLVDEPTGTAVVNGIPVEVAPV